MHICTYTYNVSFHTDFTLIDSHSITLIHSFTYNPHITTWDEKYFGMKPDLCHIKIFCSIAFVHIPNEKRKKFNMKLEKCILVEYSLEQKGYKFYNPSTKKVRVSRDIVFDESTS